jgi:hypothetical protein
VKFLLLLPFSSIQSPIFFFLEYSFLPSFILLFYRYFVRSFFFTPSFLHFLLIFAPWISSFLLQPSLLTFSFSFLGLPMFLKVRDIPPARRASIYNFWTESDCPSCSEWLA